MTARTGYPVKNFLFHEYYGGAGRPWSCASKFSWLASSYMLEAGLSHCGKSRKHLRKFRVGSLNVNTLSGMVCEVVETLSCRKVDVCCVQETRYCGGHCHTIKRSDTRYKLFWSGNDKGAAGVGMMVVEEWIEKAFEVVQASKRIILVKLVVG